MNILEFYLNQQKFSEWYQKFQSTAKNKSGKIFSHTSTNYRNMMNFLSDLDKFKSNNGVSRSEFKKYDSNGQEVDKQRILPLTNANIIKKDIDRFYLTPIVYVCLDLIESDYTDEEKWILLYILLLDYRNEERNNDLILTSIEYMRYLMNAGLSEQYILEELKNLQKLNDIEEIFRTDIFWYITFAKDRQFLKKYKDSSEEEKTMLHSYVINEQKNKKSKDCIGHKFVAGGQMLKSTFLEESELLYYTYIISKYKYGSLEELIDKILDLYSEIHCTLNKDIINKFIKNHRSMYQYVFEHTGLRRIENE